MLTITEALHDLGQGQLTKRIWEGHGKRWKVVGAFTGPSIALRPVGGPEDGSQDFHLGADSRIAQDMKPVPEMVLDIQSAQQKCGSILMKLTMKNVPPHLAGEVQAYLDHLAKQVSQRLHKPMLDVEADLQAFGTAAIHITNKGDVNVGTVLAEDLPFMGRNGSGN